MKNPTIIRAIIAITGILMLSLATSCTKEYVVKPEDIQDYLDKGIDLTITLPAGSSFDLVYENGKLVDPSLGLEKIPTPSTPPATPVDTITNNGGNGEKKFRHAGAFVQQAFAGTGAYQCPSVCSIIIRTPL